MSRPELSSEQLSVYEKIEHTREHIFVTGRAGTGKSTILNHLSYNTSKIIAVCAPTGVAALNVGGQTIHSLLRLPTGVIADHDLDQPSELRSWISQAGPAAARFMFVGYQLPGPEAFPPSSPRVRIEGLTTLQGMHFMRLTAIFPD